MGTHSADASTAKSASAGAQAQDQQLAQNAAKNQAFSDQTRNSLFGKYDATSGRYGGGTISPFLDPSAIDAKGLNGAYGDTFANATNKVGTQTKNAVATTTQDLANRGMGKAPAGFAADQERKAYQDEAGTLGDLYTGLRSSQRSDAETNYWNATNILNANANQSAALSLQGNQAAAGNYANLYGTGEQQVQGIGSSILGAAAGVGAGWASGGFKHP